MKKPIEKYSFQKAFTLAELLIALAILGVIATFTIPKVLISSQSQQFKSIAKESAASLSQAYQQASYDKGKGGALNAVGDIMPYINYVRVDTISQIDGVQGATTKNCSSITCYRLHNGAMIMIDDHTFGGTATTNAISFMVDPDGKVTDSTTNGPGEISIFFPIL